MSTPMIDAMTALANAAPAGLEPSAPAVAAEAVSPAPEAAKEPAKPAYLNPYAKRASKASPVPAPVKAVEPSVSEDPRIASMSAELKDLMSVVSRQAELEIASQPESVKAYIAKLAGDSPAKQLEALHSLKASGLLTSTPVVPKGASTSPEGAPKPVGPTNQDAAILAEYQSLKGSPILQAQYQLQNGAALARAMASRN